MVIGDTVFRAVFASYRCPILRHRNFISLTADIIQIDIMKSETGYSAPGLKPFAISKSKKK
jgi:hypothetical protein